MGNLALVLFLARQVFVPAEVPIGIEVARRINAPVGLGNSLFPLALELLFIVGDATTLRLNSQLGHQVNRLLVDRQQLEQPPEFLLQHVTGYGAVLAATEHARLVLVAADAVGVGAPGQPCAQTQIVVLLGQPVTMSAVDDRAQRIRLRIPLDTLIHWPQCPPLAHQSH
ncbi:MAG: hypothetical protein M5U05_19440 [Anaerolineales bacterium]|nr:hypothetical protein [Anaerolineales bacterium]